MPFTVLLLSTHTHTHTQTQPNDAIILEKYELRSVGTTKEDNDVQNTNGNSLPPPPPVEVTVSNEVGTENLLRVGIYLEVAPEQLQVTPTDVKYEKFGTNTCPQGSSHISSAVMCEMVFNLLM